MNIAFHWLRGCAGRTCVAVILVLLGHAPAFSQNIDREAMLQLQAKVTSGTLPNGFRYAILPTGNRAEQDRNSDIIMMLAVDAGRGDDGPKPEVAHLVEHVLARKLKGEDGRYSYANDLALSWGYTSQADMLFASAGRSTLYRLQMPKGKIHAGLAILRDIAHGRPFDESDIIAERSIEMGEYLQGYQDAELPFMVASRLFDDPVNPAMRNRDDVESARKLTAKDVISFYRKWYRANSETLYIVGDVDASATAALVRSLFADIPAGAPPSSWSALQPSRKKDRIISIDRLPAPYAIFQYDSGMHFEKERKLYAATYTILADLLGKRFALIADEIDTPVIEATVEAQYNDSRSALIKGLNFTVMSQPGEFASALRRVLQEVALLSSKNSDELEFSDIKNRLIEKAPADSETDCIDPSDPFVLLDTLARGNDTGRLGALVCGFRLGKSDFVDVTIDDVRQVARQMLDLNKIKLRAIHPKAHKDVTMTVVRKGFYDAIADPGKPLSITRNSVADISGKWENVALPIAHSRAEELVPSIIVDETNEDSGGFVLNMVAAPISSLAPEQRRLVPPILSFAKAGGFGGFSSDEMHEFMAQNGLNYSVDVNKESSKISITGPADKFEAGTKLLYAILLGPNRDTAARRKYDRYLIKREAISQLPGIFLQNIIDRAIKYGAPPPASWQDAQKLTMATPGNAEIATIWSQLFQTNSKISVKIAPKVDRQAVEPLARELSAQVAMWSNKGGVAPDQADDAFNGADRRFKYSRGYGKATEVVILVPITLDNGRTAEQLTGLLKIFNVKGRFYHRIRIAESGAYEPFVTVMADPDEPARAYFKLRFICYAPDAERLIAAARDEFHNMQLLGWNSAEIASLERETPGSSRDSSNFGFPSLQAAAVDADIPASASELLNVVRAANVRDMLIFEATP